jgi:hypothetical protein
VVAVEQAFAQGIVMAIGIDEFFAVGFDRGLWVSVMSEPQVFRKMLDLAEQQKVLWLRARLGLRLHYTHKLVYPRDMERHPCIVNDHRVLYVNLALVRHEELVQLALWRAEVVLAQ